MREFARKIRDQIRLLRLRFETPFDHQYLEPNTPLSRQYAHDRWLQQLAKQFNQPGMRVLEPGSREVTGVSQARKLFTQAEYVGFDFYAGANVDVVGDAHKASSYFKDGERFDLIFSSACFEHFAMPWVVAQERVVVLGNCRLRFYGCRYFISSGRVSTISLWRGFWYNLRAASAEMLTYVRQFCCRSMR